MTQLNACPICDGTDIALDYSGKPIRAEWRDDRTFDVFKCRTCSHGFLNPVPSEVTLGEYYGSQYVAYQAEHGTGALQPAVEQAQREGRFRHVDLQQDMDVLDVGCGSGSFLYVIQNVVQSVQGIEPSEHGVRTCQSLGVPVFHGDLEAYSKSYDRVFDLITLNHVVEHHPDPRRLFALCRRHLKPGGRIWISVPNAGCFFARRLKANWHSSDLPVHLQHFCSRSLRRAVESAGFKTEALRTESENSLPGSTSAYFRRFGIPGRLSKEFVKGPMSKSGWLGRRIDAAGGGEALLISASSAA